MHALMQTATPTISYCLPETTQLMRQVWALRDKGIEVYFTQDAGPNIKLIFMKKFGGPSLLKPTVLYPAWQCHFLPLSTGLTPR